MWSCRAPATISEADADPSFIKTINGFPSVKSPLEALNLEISFLSLPLIETISPEPKKLFVTYADRSKRPPGLQLRSRMNPDK